MKKIILSALLLCSLSFSDEYAVVANKSMKDLSVNQIRAIFLKKLLVIGTDKAVPINLEPRNPLRLKFEKEILRISFSRLKVYWTKEHYLGHRPPINMKSQKGIKAFVKRINGAIGYININNLDKELKVIYKWKD